MTTARQKTAAKNESNGRGVDAAGRPAIDPTANVIALTEAANLRQDGLREAEAKRVTAEVAHVAEMTKLRADHTEALAALRSLNGAEMRRLETARIDAIRQVDVAAHAAESARTRQEIEALARLTASNADNLRTLVATTAQTLASSTAEQNKQQLDRIAALERSSYIGAGRESEKDPAMATLIEEVKALRISNSSVMGKSMGAKEMWGYIVGGIGIMLAIATFYLHSMPVQTQVVPVSVPTLVAPTTQNAR